VARGIVFEPVTTLQGMELSDNEVKVTILEVIIPDVLVHVPTNEIYYSTYISIFHRVA